MHPQVESDRGNVNTVEPRSCYDEGKRVVESMTFEYKHLHNIDAKIVRIFDTYGPKIDIDDGRVVLNFIRQPLTVYRDGKQTRSLCRERESRGKL